MRQRVAFALAVLVGTIYWADCGFNVPISTLPNANTFFAGCFQGPVSNPSGFGEVTLILEANVDNDLTLGGCMRLSPALGSRENATLAGEVLTEAEQARVTVTRTTGEPPFIVLVQRAPAGSVAAATVSVTNESGAPFTAAANLAVCPVAVTCSAMSIPMPFLPDGGAQ